MIGDLRFIETSRIIKFFYKKPCRDGGHYYVIETIPERIVKQGENAILEYASNKIKKAENVWKKRKSIEDDIRKNHIPIRTKYKDGTSLEGRIIEATSRYIRVKLDKPFKGHRGINFGFGSAVAGHYVFTDDHEISQHGYDAAYRALCWAYENALHKPKKELVDCLNKKVKRLKVNHKTKRIKDAGQTQKKISHEKIAKALGAEEIPFEELPPNIKHAYRRNQKRRSYDNENKKTS